MHVLDKTRQSAVRGRSVVIREVPRCMCGNVPIPPFQPRADGWSLAVGCSSPANAGPTDACSLTQGNMNGRREPRTAQGTRWLTLLLPPNPRRRFAASSLHKLSAPSLAHQLQELPGTNTMITLHNFSLFDPAMFAPRPLDVTIPSRPFG